MKKAILLAFVWGIVSYAFAFGDVVVGVGYSFVKLPSNNPASIFVPNGETTPGYIDIFLGSNKLNKVGFGISGYGYTSKKWLNNYYFSYSEVTWEVLHLNGYLTYRTLLGQDKNLNPSLGLRAGGSIVHIDLSEYYSPRRTHNNETKLAPYIGADMLIPLSRSPLNIFFAIEKVFCKYNKINVGALNMSAGIAYAPKR
jgi:hypothetical protein